MTFLLTISLDDIYIDNLEQYVKIEQTAKGGRITVHVNANDGTTAMREAIFLYQNTKLQMQSLGEQVAPIEMAKKEREAITV